MVFELRAASGSSRGTLASVGQKLGVNPETLRNWVEKAEIDSGQRFTLTPADEPPQHESGNRPAAASIDSHAPTDQSAGHPRRFGDPLLRSDSFPVTLRGRRRLHLCDRYSPFGASARVRVEDLERGA